MTFSNWSMPKVIAVARIFKQKNFTREKNVLLARVTLPLNSFSLRIICAQVWRCQAFFVLPWQNI